MHTKFRFIAAATVLASFAATAALAASNPPEVAFKSDNWTVVRSSGGLFSKGVECTGTYKDDKGIQLTADGLSVHLNGELQSITVRFDDKPARPVRYASRMEQNLRAVQITGGDFAELLASSRLRVQSTTAASGVVSEEVNLAGIKDAYASIKTGCSAPASAPSNTMAAPAAAVAPAPRSAAAPTCSDEQIARMEEQGLKTKQIVAICR
jgi:hypothetical protein